MFRRMRLVFCLFLLGCDDAPVQKKESCDLVACADGAFIDVPATVGTDRVEGSTVEACRNQSCFHGTFGAWSSQSDLVTLHLTGSFSMPPVVSASVVKANGALELQITWMFTHAYDLKDGDQYDVTWKASDGTLLAESHPAATYVKNQPNGPSCPPTCMQFSSGF